LTILRGLGYLIPSYKDAGKIPDPSIGAKNKPCGQGALVRETAALFDPNGTGDVDFKTFLDPAVDVVKANGKWVGIEYLVGMFMAPKWYSDHPGHYLTLEKIDPSTGKPTITTVPWDSEFQKYSEKVETQFANKYDGVVAYSKVAFGKTSESFIVSTPADQSNADALATGMGYVSDAAKGYTPSQNAWVIGAKWCIDMKARLWPKTWIFLVTGQPFPDDVGAKMLSEVMDYGFATYPGHFVARADNAYANKPHPGEPSTIIQANSFKASGAAMFQMGNSMNNATDMQSAMDNALGFDFTTDIEIFDSDCNNQALAQILTDTATKLMARGIGAKAHPIKPAKHKKPKARKG
jgi:hypothetical protein